MTLWRRPWYWISARPAASPREGNQPAGQAVGEPLQVVDLSPQPSGATLLRRFTVRSFVTTIVVGVLFGTMTARHVENFAFRRQAQGTEDRVLEVSSARLVVQDFLASPRAKRTRYEIAVRDLIGKAGIVHVAVWNRQGEVLYSDSRELPGSTSASSALLKGAFDGQLQWQLVPSGGQGASSTRRLEVFIPVVVAGIPGPVAVYQVLSDLTDLVPALTRLKSQVEISVVLGVLFLYAALYSIVLRGSREIARQQLARQRTFVGMIRSLVAALDARDMYTGDHSFHVSKIAVAIARAMGLSMTMIDEVQLTSLLHDVGKIGIPDGVLNKPGPLTPEEWVIMKRHSVFGYKILGPAPISKEVKLAVRHSHERWDGKGYPDGLSGQQIPLAARVVAVVDAYTAITTDRPYRQAQRPEKAMEEIKRCAGTQFDPKVVDAFLMVLHQTAVGESIQARLDGSKAGSARPVPS